MTDTHSVGSPRTAAIGSTNPESYFCVHME
jgi:hypothetical protein